MEIHRSKSLEEDVTVMNEIGLKFLKSSTQGYQLLIAKRRLIEKVDIKEVVSHKCSVSSNIFDSETPTEEDN